MELYYILTMLYVIICTVSCVIMQVNYCVFNKLLTKISMYFAITKIVLIYKLYCLGSDIRIKSFSRPPILLIICVGNYSSANPFPEKYYFLLPKLLTRLRIAEYDCIFLLVSAYHFVNILTHF